jgi:hypothetical protein
MMHSFDAAAVEVGMNFGGPAPAKCIYRLPTLSRPDRHSKAASGRAVEQGRFKSTYRPFAPGWV